jgi:hypothetical protein
MNAKAHSTIATTETKRPSPFLKVSSRKRRDSTAPGQRSNKLLEENECSWAVGAGNAILLNGALPDGNREVVFQDLVGS